MDFEDVKNWLRAQLRSGPVKAKEITERGRKIGYRGQWLRQARYAIGAKENRVYRADRSRRFELYWHLPEANE